MAQQIEGKVVSVDMEGNLVTDIAIDRLEIAPHDKRLTIFCDEHETNGLHDTDHGQPAMTYIGMIGDGGFLQLSIVGESAHAMLGVQVGEKVVVKWP